LDKAFISFELNQKKNIFNYEISTEFIDAISDDINFPNAVAVI
jgi:hypothetical protein